MKRLLATIASASFAVGVIPGLHAHASPQPRIKGGPFICPNGRFLSPSVLGDWNMESRLHAEKTWNKIIEINGEIIIATNSLGDYSGREMMKLMEKLVEGVNIPTSYKLVNVRHNYGISPFSAKGVQQTIGKREGSIHYEFENSEGSKMSMTLQGDGGNVLDNNGNVFYTSGFRFINRNWSRDDNATLMRCEEESIIYKQVAKFELGGLTDEYGEEVSSPTLFFIREIRVQTEDAPTSKKSLSL